MKEALAAVGERELKGEEWIRTSCHRWELFKGKAMPADNDWEDKEIMFTAGDPILTLTRYNLSENPDVHIILAKAHIQSSEAWDMGAEPGFFSTLELKEFERHHRLPEHFCRT